MSRQNTLGGSNKMLPTEEAADYLGVTPRMLRDSYGRWGLTPSRYGKSLKFRVRDLDAMTERLEVRTP